MADDVLFEVDASQIVAKLHLAGCQAASKRSTEDFFINTGIKNDNPKANPNNPGKVAFDLKNSTGKYELGYATEMIYVKSYDVVNLVNQIYDHLAKTSGDKSHIDDKSDSNEHKEFEERKEELKTILAAKNIKFENDSLDTTEGIRKIRDDVIVKMIDDENKDYNNILTELKTKVAKSVKEYMNVFAGSDNVNPITESSFKMITLSDKVKDSNSNGLVKNFEIQPATEQEVAKMVEQFKLNFKKDSKKANCKQKVCFVVKYTLNVDK